MDIESILYIFEMGSNSTAPLFSNYSPVNKIGKFLLVSYNTAQIIFELTTIVLVVSNYSFQWKGEVDKKSSYIASW